MGCEKVVNRALGLHLQNHFLVFFVAKIPNKMTLRCRLISTHYQFMLLEEVPVLQKSGFVQKTSEKTF